MRVFPAMVVLALASLVLAVQAQEPVKVDTEGVTASILFEAPISGGHVAELKGKYKLRVTEIAIAAGGYVGHHNHLGPGIRQMTEGEMEYIMPDGTVTYRVGDYFFETGDVSHRVESPGLSKHLLFEILPIDVDGPSLIPSAVAEEISAQSLGKIDFQNSGSAEAQPAFIEGVLYLHNFEYEQAAASFTRAQEIDPDFVLAYWGEAMTHHHSMWVGEHDQSAGTAVLRRLGRTPEERAAKAPTAREKAYLRAVEVLFGAAEESSGRAKPEREVLYREAMRRLHEGYPDDHEATSFYALSVLGAGRASRDFPTYMRAAAILMEVWDANRMHPGATHYLIHSFDDPAHAPLGLPMALAYSQIAPAAPHAQHMTSHIFLGLGRWTDVVSANETAFANELESEGTDEWSREASHYVHWLHYGYLQQGRHRRAESLLDLARERLQKGAPARERSYYGTLYARHLVESGAWQSAERWAAPAGVGIPNPTYHFARTFAAIQRSDLDAARESARLVQPGGAGNPEVVVTEDIARVLHLEIEARLALAGGDQMKAITLLREAATREAAMPPAFGPPAVVKPAAELLGDVLVELGRADEAIASYTAQLARTPRRAAALLGLARAARASNDTALFAEAHRALSQIWRSADESVLSYLKKEDGR